MMVTQHADVLCRQLIVITKVILMLVRAGPTNPYSEILLYNMSSLTITSFFFFETTLTAVTVVSPE
jgi:hypothetical protein